MKEDFEKFIDVLRDNKPEFLLRLDSPALVLDTGEPLTQYLNFLKYWSPKSFKKSMEQELKEYKFQIKKEISLGIFKKEYLKTIYIELSNKLEDFQQVKYINKKHHFQPELLIYEWIPDEKTYFKFEDIKDKFKKEILAYFDIKHEVITNLLEFFDELLNDEIKELIKKPISKKENSNTKIFTLNEIADMLHVTKRTLYNWKDNGSLPFTQIGSKIYLTQEQLDELLEQHQIKPSRFRK